MHDIRTSIRSIWCMAYQIQYNGIIAFFIKLGHPCPILTLAHRTLKSNKKREFPT